MRWAVELLAFFCKGRWFCLACHQKKVQLFGTMEPRHPALRAVCDRNLQGKARKKRMGNKLVFVSGAPFWFTPEGRFEAAEQSNGLFVERVMLRTERGLREIVNGKIVR